ncbi:MAG TPA: type II toxin-antitoxin system RelE/ParE family toxin [Chloroflexota bacterium]|nr:type II toxin-antitoxin system RelE/ParE family toxin [Chloroflexota bacterium]
MTTAGNLDWMIVFYIEANGDSPVEEFLGSLDPKTQARFLWSIEQLRARNLQAGEPLVRHIEGKVWELRRESGTNTYRLFYVFLSGRRILFLHGFQKKTPKTPRPEIEIALRRLQRFVEQEGGD